MTATVAHGVAAEDRTAPRTTASGWVLRVAVTLHLVVVVAQPVTAGVYLSGNVAGLLAHGRGADAVSVLALAQVLAAVAVWVRARRAWPTIVTVVLLVLEAVQYGVGESGQLWLHVPLGVATVVASVALFCAVWLVGFPRRRRRKAGTTGAGARGDG